jgi:hypothetical protein
MESKKLELRMYGLVNYQLSGIQKGIQFGHSVVEYSLLDNSLYKEWALNHKTFIILNGGTTNNNPDNLGTLNKHLETLKEMDITFSSFCEPDLGDQLTAITFIVDERVFLKDNSGYVYKEFEDWLLEYPNPFVRIESWNTAHIKNVRNMCKNGNKELKSIYNKWVEYMGGEKNIFLRDFLKKFNLA